MLPADPEKRRTWAANPWGDCCERTVLDRFDLDGKHIQLAKVASMGVVGGSAFFKLRPPI